MVDAIGTVSKRRQCPNPALVMHDAFDSAHNEDTILIKCIRPESEEAQILTLMLRRKVAATLSNRMQRTRNSVHRFHLLHCLL